MFAEPNGIKNVTNSITTTRMNIMNEAYTFYKNDLKTYINIGEKCCFQGLTLCDEENCNFKEYLTCYENLKDVSDDDFNNRLFIKVEDENNYVYGYN